MEWMKWVWALLLGGMIFMLLPQAKAMVRHSPKGTSAEWRAVLLPLALVVGFVVLLIASV